METSLNPMDVLINAAADTLTKGGATWHKEFYPVPAGWLVSSSKYGWIIPVHLFNKNILLQFMAIHAFVNIPYRGAWLDDQGRVHLDCNYLIEDREEAIRIGRENNQLAIYHNGTSEEIKL